MQSLPACPECAGQVVRQGSRGPVPRYCSKACQERAKDRRANDAERLERIAARAAIACLYCGASLAERRATKYCSLQCANRDSDRYHRRREMLRSQRTGNPVSFRSIAERDGWRCYLCGDAVDESVRGPHALAPSLDHVVPLSKGGLHAPTNLALAHLGCNRRKSDRLLQEIA